MKVVKMKKTEKENSLHIIGLADKLAQGYQVAATVNQQLAEDGMLSSWQDYERYLREMEDK